MQQNYIDSWQVELKPETNFICKIMQVTFLFFNKLISNEIQCLRICGRYRERLEYALIIFSTSAFFQVYYIFYMLKVYKRPRSKRDGALYPFISLTSVQ